MLSIAFHPATLGIAAAGPLRPSPGVLANLIAATAFLWLFLEFRQAMIRRSDAASHDQGSLLVLRLAYFCGAIAALLAAGAFPAAAIHPRAVGEWIGLFLLLCGIALRLWCFRTLGRYFTFTVQTSADQPVITDGPYRYVRHPGYTGILLAITGLSLYIGNWVSAFALLAIVAAGLVYRINVEERALLQTLGDRYRDYAATRKRLIPLVW